MFLRIFLCDVPALGGGLTYTQVAAGADHTVLLRSDGTAVACGLNDNGHCDVPALGRGLSRGTNACVFAHIPIYLPSPGLRMFP